MEFLVSRTALFLVLVLLAFKARRIFSAFLLSACWGLLSFAFVNLSGLLTGITLPLCLPTVLCAVFLGIPGVSAMLLSRFLWIC